MTANKDKKREVVDYASAESEFFRFGEAMDLDFSAERLEEEDLKAFKETKANFIKAIQAGKLTVDDQGQPVLTCSDGSTLTFREPKGADFMQMDKRRTQEQIGKVYTMIASICGVPVTEVGKLPNRDIKVAQTVIVLFLG